VSPEQIDALTKLLGTASDTQSVTAACRSWTCSPALLTAWAGLIGAIALPVVSLVAIFAFFVPLSRLLTEAESIKFLGIEITRRRIEKVLDESGKEAGTHEGLSSGPTSSERERAHAISEAAERAPPDFLKREAQKLAWEYEITRETNIPGDTRTRKMEMVMAKMKTFSPAIYSSRHEFMASGSAGQRLLAIAAMQLKPDFDALDWLVDRVRNEKPFIGYHAAVALNAAAHHPEAKLHLDELRRAAKSAADAVAALPPDTDRTRVIRDFVKTANDLGKA
jgi:hypothetical protein